MDGDTKLISKQNKTISAMKGKINALRERQQELESALLGMIAQSNCDDSNNHFMHSFMSCDEQAYSVLDIEYGESVAEVYKRYASKWKENGRKL